jgi:hypothetical protein
MLKRLLVLLFACCIGSETFPQFYSTGQDPASIKWRQIKTEKYQLIYPSSFSQNAQYLANVMDLVADHSTSTLHSKVPRIPVVIHQQSAQSNGFTLWAPRRIELFPCPPQNSYAEEWLEQLAIHEYRHAVQISKMNQGFSKVLYCIFGEQATGAVLGLFVPAWFLEGDATCSETALSNSGRGRLPAFENVLRSQLLEKGSYSYDKATMGSYRTFTPDAYVLGYHLVAWGREQYGPGLWNKALDRSAKLPFMVVPFSSGIHSITGMGKTRFYKTAIKNLTERWAAQDSATLCSSCNTVTRREPKNYTDYNFAVLNDSNSVIALRSEWEDISRIVHIDIETGKEDVIFTPGDYIKDALSVSGELLAWSEQMPDARWENRSYAVIRTYDMEKRKSRYLTRKSRYFFPAISPDAKKIATVGIDLLNNCSLNLLDAQTGEVIKSYPFPDKQLVTEPAWSPDGEELLFCVVTDRGKSMAEIRLENDSLVWLIRNDEHYISGPVYLSEDTIMFTDSYSGIDNIYYLDETTREIFRVHSSRFGTYNTNFTPRKDVLFWSAITSDGLMLMKSPVEPEKWTHVDHVTNQSIRLYDSIARQEGCNIQDSVMHYGIDRLLFTVGSRQTAVGSRQTADGDPKSSDSIRIVTYQEKRYSKPGHLFNPHSWAPLSIDVNNLEVRPGVSVQSQNVLSSMTANAGYRYNYNDRTGTFYAGLTYAGLYPLIGMDYEYGSAAGYEEDTAANTTLRYTWNESAFSMNMSIPWNFSRGKYYRYLTPRISTGITSYLHNKNTPAEFFKGYTWNITYSIYAANNLYSNFKDMYPRFGQNVYAVYRNGPFGGYDPGSLLACEANFFFPGLFKHHGIRLYGGGQQRWNSSSGHNLFSNIITLPRGTDGFNAGKMYSFSINYKLPLFYPDWSLGSVMYIKRFKLNLFYDFAGGNDPGKIYSSSSAGAELTADLHLLRFVFPFELGLRTLYIPQSGKWGFQFLYGVNF